VWACGRVAWAAIPELRYLGQHQRRPEGQIEDADRRESTSGTDVLRTRTTNCCLSDKAMEWWKSPAGTGHRSLLSGTVSKKRTSKSAMSVEIRQVRSTGGVLLALKVQGDWLPSGYSGSG